MSTEDPEDVVEAIRDAVMARRVFGGRTHWEGCVTARHHEDCAIVFLLREIDHLRRLVNAVGQP